MISTFISNKTYIETLLHVMRGNRTHRWCYWNVRQLPSIAYAINTGNSVNFQKYAVNLANIDTLTYRVWKRWKNITFTQIMYTASWRKKRNPTWKEKKILQWNSIRFRHNLVHYPRSCGDQNPRLQIVPLQYTRLIGVFPGASFTNMV